jgi:F-type H+-transporting ATPase subunit c
VKKTAVLFMLLLIAFAAVPSAYAQGTVPAKSETSWIAIAACFGIALAAAFCGIAQSRVAASACEGMARNPGAAASIRAAMFLGLVFPETLALFTLVVVFTVIFKVL